MLFSCVPLALNIYKIRNLNLQLKYFLYFWKYIISSFINGNGDRSVLTLGSLCLVCCGQDTVLFLVYWFWWLFFNDSKHFSFRMAHMFPDCVGEVDVISDAECIKKLLKLPYQPNGTVSIVFLMTFFYKHICSRLKSLKKTKKNLKFFFTYHL